MVNRFRQLVAGVVSGKQRRSHSSRHSSSKSLSSAVDPVVGCMFEALEGRQMLTVTAALETTPVPHSGDAADDPAIWVNPAGASSSTIIGTDKQGGLAVYDMAGKQISYHAVGNVNNVDLRYSFPLGGQKVDLVTATNRSNNSISVHKVNPTTRQLENVAARTLSTSLGTVYGVAMYHSPQSGKFYTFVVDKDSPGKVEQWELFDNGAGKVDGKVVRTFSVGSISEGMVVDDEKGALYISEENVGVWKYGAEPTAGTTRTKIDSVGSGGNLTADVEGLAIYKTSDGKGYLMVSNQGNNEFMAYDRNTGQLVKRFKVSSGAVDGVNDTDGIDVSNVNFGGAFAEGVFVVQDGSNDSGNQNFKLVPWATVARDGSTQLTVDTSYNPRGGATTTPTPTPTPTAPAAPSSLTAAAASSSQINLSWNDNSSDESGFKIERSVAGGSFTQIATVGAGVRTYSNTGLTAATAYSYRVRAYNSTGDSAYSATASATTQTATTTPTPTPTTGTFIAAGSTWKYLDNGSDQGTGWRSISFNDSTWKSGAAQLGYGDSDVVTAVGYGTSSTNKYITTYFRKSFNVTDPAAVSALALKLMRDDGAVVYLNGTEVFRSNMPTGTVGYTTRASSAIDSSGESTWHAASIDPKLLVAGNNVIAVELHQASSSSSDTSFDFQLNGTAGSTTTPTPTPTPTAPAAPSSLTAAAASSSQINLSWNDNSSDESGFKIERSVAGGSFTQIATVGAGVRTYSNTGLTAGTAYSYRVRAYNSTGDSAYSATASATTQTATTTPTPTPTPTSPIVYSGPITITKGGTYTGNWESQNASVAAVTISTTEPVVILNANIRSRGHLIKSAVDHTKITVRNTNGYGVNPNVAGQAAGRFLNASYFDSVTVENSYMEGTSGIYLLNYRGNFTTSQTVKIMKNRALNIDGRLSNGAGGYMDFNERTRKGTSTEEKGYKRVQFLQLDKVQGVPGMEVAWNQVVNEPGKSRVEDNINIYKSSGSSSSPMLIHDNYINGAYTIKPWQGDTSDATYDYDWDYAGGGILLGDGSSTTKEGAAAYIKAYNNTIINTTNYGIAIYAGHDLEFYNNRIFSTGKLADGRTIWDQNVGAYIWDGHGDKSYGTFYNNTGHDNLIGWEKGTGRNDWWMPDATSWTNNTRYSGDVTEQTLASEFTLWQQKASNSGIKVGVL